MHLNKKNGYFVSSLEKVGDPIRTNLFKVHFDFTELRRYEEALGTNFNIFDSETLSLMIKDYTPPVVEMHTDTIYYMGGAKKVLPTTQEVEDSMTLTIQENSNLTGYKNIMRWMQHCVNNYSYSPEKIGEEVLLLGSNKYNNAIGYGAPIYKNKDDLNIANFFINTHTMCVDMYDYTNGEAIMRVSYVNIFPTKITPPKLEYNSANLYQFQVEFKYSRYVYTIPTNVVDFVSKNNSSYLAQAPAQWGNSN